MFFQTSRVFSARPFLKTEQEIRTEHIGKKPDCLVEDRDRQANMIDVVSGRDSSFLALHNPSGCGAADDANAIAPSNMAELRHPLRISTP